MRPVSNCFTSQSVGIESKWYSSQKQVEEHMMTPKILDLTYKPHLLSAAGFRKANGYTLKRNHFITNTIPYNGGLY